MLDWLDEFGRRITRDLESAPPEFLVEWRITPTEFSQLCEALCRERASYRRLLVSTRAVLRDAETLRRRAAQRAGA